MLTLGLAHCLRAHSVILRDHNEKKLAYAELTHWEISKKWYLTTGFAYATACFHRQICLQHQRCEDEEELEVEEEEEERFLWRHCRSEKAFVCAGMCATTQKVKFSLRAAYAELTRNLAIVVGNYNPKNRTIKKTHKETI